MVASALVSGVWPAYLREKVRAECSMMPGAEHDPEIVLDVIQDRAKRYADIEDYNNHRRQTRRAAKLNAEADDPNQQEQVGSYSRQSHGTPPRDIHPHAASRRCPKCNGVGHSSAACPSPPDALGTQAHSKFHGRNASESTSRNSGNFTASRSGGGSPGSRYRSESSSVSTGVGMRDRSSNFHKSQTSGESRKPYWNEQVHRKSDPSSQPIPVKTLLTVNSQGSSQTVPEKTSHTVNPQEISVDPGPFHSTEEFQPAVQGNESLDPPARASSVEQPWAVVEPDESKHDNSCFESYDDGAGDDEDVGGMQIGSLDISTVTQDDSDDPVMERIRTVRCGVSPVYPTSFDAPITVFVDAVLDSGASVSCLTQETADQLGVVEDWKTGPLVNLVDGRRARLTKKTALVDVHIPITQNGETEMYHRRMRFAVIPGTTQRMIIGQQMLGQLQSDMSYRGQPPLLGMSGGGT